MRTMTLAEKIRESGKKRSFGDKIRLLQEARILDANYNYDQDFFPRTNAALKQQKTLITECISNNKD